ncbi:hypothetical protein M446_1168 [Methylobacterium sp. 4-46]|nr:hypothetical protein M446_1168 [Methylobacterium sp. 4-46]
MARARAFIKRKATEHDAITRVLTRPSVDAKTAAEVLDLSLAAARAAIVRGEIPAVKLGRSYRVPTLALREMLALPTGAPRTAQ